LEGGYRHEKISGIRQRCGAESEPLARLRHPSHTRPSLSGELKRSTNQPTSSPPPLAVPLR
jgi:hypothetical protein